MVGHAWRGEGTCVAGETATAADGTHPTGMLSFCGGVCEQNNIINAYVDDWTTEGAIIASSVKILTEVLHKDAFQ